MRKLRHEEVTSPPQDGTASKEDAHRGSDPRARVLTHCAVSVPGQNERHGARPSEEPRTELGRGAERLTCRVMGHGLCQHGLPAARRAVHEDASGRIDPNSAGKKLLTHACTENIKTTQEVNSDNLWGVTVEGRTFTG